jgi:hypothetical protein
MSKRAKKFKVGDRVMMVGTVKDIRPASVGVDWDGMSQTWWCASRVVHPHTVRATPEARPKVAKKDKAQADFESELDTVKRIARAFKPAKVAKKNSLDGLLCRSLVPKKWRPETDAEIESMLDSIPNTPMPKAKVDRMLRKINGQEPVFTKKPTKQQPTKGAKKKANNSRPTRQEGKQ